MFFPPAPLSPWSSQTPDAASPLLSPTWPASLSPFLPLVTWPSTAYRRRFHKLASHFYRPPLPKSNFLQPSGGYSWNIYRQEIKLESWSLNNEWVPPHTSLSFIPRGVQNTGAAASDVVWTQCARTPYTANTVWVSGRISDLSAAQCETLISVDAWQPAQTVTSLLRKRGLKKRACIQINSTAVASSFIPTRLVSTRGSEWRAQRWPSGPDTSPERVYKRAGEATTPSQQCADATTSPAAA